MITGIHTLIYTKDPEGARRIFRDVLQYPHVDAGDGWLIFKLPPAELGIHPVEAGEPAKHELWFMCDDINATAAELKRRGITVSKPVADHGWGLVTAFVLPGGEEVGLYEPRHPKAIDLKG